MRLEFNKGWCILRDDDNIPIWKKNWFEVNGLSVALSKKYGKEISLMSFKKAFELFNSDDHFRELLTDYWMWCKEIFTEKELEKEGCDVRDILKVQKTICIGRIAFDDDGFTAVGCDWDNTYKRFSLDFAKPARKYKYCVAIFGVKE